MKKVSLFLLFLFIFPSLIFKDGLADDTPSLPKPAAATLAHLHHHHHHHHHRHHNWDDVDSPSSDDDDDGDDDDDDDDGGGDDDDDDGDDGNNDGDDDGDNDGDGDGDRDGGDDKFEKCLDSFSTIEKCIEEAIVSIFRLRFYVGPACCEAFTTIDKECSPKYDDRTRKHHFIKAMMKDSCHRDHPRPTP